MTHLETIQLIIAMVAQEKWKNFQMDVKRTFLCLS